jgi:glyoxylase-like metal-dependent hydrolase (beta-lactamase superfamily II)
LQSISSGGTTLHVINLGDFKLHLSHMLKVSEEDRSRYGDLFDRDILSPGNSIVIRTPQEIVLVDPNDYAVSCLPDSEYFPSKSYLAPPDLLSQLGEISLKPEDVSRVVITHAHYDHYAGVTKKGREGKFEPAFPNAKYYLGYNDWENPAMKEALTNEGSEPFSSLKVLHDQGMLELVKGTYTIAESIQIVPSPGESPGHQLLEVNSPGQSFFCIGDLFHHWVEVEEPDWGPDWTELKQNAASRRVLMERAFSKGAIVIPGHMVPGQIKRREGSMTKFRWEELSL